ncbi:Protein of unknown function, partial [Gryllus bimaculatus]
FASRHSARDLAEDEELLHQCSLDDVRMVLFTNRPVKRRRDAPDGEHLDFPLEDVLRTGAAQTDGVFSFGRADEEVWNLLSGDPQSDVFRREFLPRLRVFSAQAHANRLDALLGAELDAAWGAPLPRNEALLAGLVAFLRAWALDDDCGAPLTHDSRELQALVLAALARRAEAAAGGGARRLRFRDGQLAPLRKVRWSFASQLKASSTLQPDLVQLGPT